MVVRALVEEYPVAEIPARPSQSKKRLSTSKLVPPLTVLEIQKWSGSPKRQAGSGFQGVAGIHAGREQRDSGTAKSKSSNGSAASAKTNHRQKPEDPAAFAKTNHRERPEDPTETQPAQRWRLIPKFDCDHDGRGRIDPDRLNPPLRRWRSSSRSRLGLRLQLARHAYAWIASPLETKAAFTHVTW